MHWRTLPEKRLAAQIGSSQRIKERRRDGFDNIHMDGGGYAHLAFCCLVCSPCMPFLLRAELQHGEVLWNNCLRRISSRKTLYSIFIYIYLFIYLIFIHQSKYLYIAFKKETPSLGKWAWSVSASFILVDFMGFCGRIITETFLSTEVQQLCKGPVSLSLNSQHSDVLRSQM